MELKTIQRKIRGGHYTITDHALIESFKDGVDLDDILRVISTGKVVETYPDRQRILMHGKTRKKKSLHVVIEHTGEEPAIVTVYVPDLKLWTKGGLRK